MISSCLRGELSPLRSLIGQQAQDRRDALALSGLLNEISLAAALPL